MSLASRLSAEKCSECGYRESRPFCNLPSELLESFDILGKHVVYSDGVTLFEEGEKAAGVFIVCSGHLKLSASSSEGRTMILKIAAPGTLLGLGAILNDQMHEVTAETIEPCELKFIRRTEFMTFWESSGEVSRRTARMLAQEYNDLLLDARRRALSGSATGRFAQLLLDWAEASSCGKPELRLTMALTHEELASMVGASRETVTRLLNQFERDGMIERRGSALLILNAPAMRACVK